MENQTFKADAGKAHPSYLEKGMPHALKAVQATLDYGAAKYEPFSWQRVAVDRYDDAARRHRIAADCGELRDPESNLLHLAHQIVCELFQLEMFLRENPDLDYTTFNIPPTDHKK